MAKNKKRISIVFATDVVGYSRLMSENEDRTLTLLKQARDFIDQTISDYGGRIANTAGDSVIAVFESATQGLLCSIKIQKTINKNNASFKPDKKLLFRIGLHMGEITSIGRDVLGGGVNIAARLEAQAEPGAILMSEALWNFVDQEEVSDPVALRGELTLKNIDKPVVCYEVLTRRAEKEGALASEKQSLQEAKQKVTLVVKALLGVALGLGLSFMLAYNLTNAMRFSADPASIVVKE